MARRLRIPPWWGEGDPPWERWPGVSLQLEATWSAPRRRWELADGRYYFDEGAAAKPRDFMRDYLRHTIGDWAGEPLALLPWQDQLIVRPLFGWKRASDGLRRFRRTLTFVPKKNGKSTLASGVGLYLMSADGEPAAMVFAAAGDEEQAGLVLEEAQRMAGGSPEFLADAGVAVLAKSIVCERTHSSFRAVTSKAATKHGKNIHGLIVDELHAQKSRELYETLKRGVASRAQPVILVITTAGSDRESICYEEYRYAKSVRDGAFHDEEVLPVIFEAATSDDWTSPDVWARCNPSLGTAKRLDYMETECRAAQNEPRKRNDFLRLELDVWTESRTVWIEPERFEVLARPEREPADLRGKTCVGGLDLSHKVDLSSFVLAIREPDGGPTEAVQVEGEDAPVGKPRVVLVDYRVHLLEWYWIPKEGMRERIARDGVPYDLWAREGWVTPTPGDIIHYGAIFQHVQEVFLRYGASELAYDPWSATDLAQRFQEDGMTVVPIRQTFAGLTAASKLFEALVRSRRLTYSGSPVTSWCVANAEIDTDKAGNICPVKPDPKGPRRIDGVSAAVTALARLMVAQEPQRGDLVSVLRW